MSEKWGPWIEVDPDAKMAYSGPEQGVGAKASWTGGKKIGVGSSTILESILNSKVGMLIEYTEPMPMQQYSNYLLEQSGSQTTVTWNVLGSHNGFFGRLTATLMNMNGMVGGMFEKGLANLKTLVESSQP